MLIENYRGIITSVVRTHLQTQYAQFLNTNQLIIEKYT